MSSWVTKIFGGSSKTSSADARKRQIQRANELQHQANSKDDSSKSSPYRGVRIYNFSSKCCGASDGVRELTFLAAHAPALPLGDCDNPDRCRCRYKHLVDRRQDARRDVDHGLPDNQFSTSNRRERRDRRRATA